VHDKSRWVPQVENIAKAARQHVEQRYPAPARLRHRSIPQIHGARLAELSDRFTVDRDNRKGGYLQDARSRSAYLLYYLPTSAATAMSALQLSGGLQRFSTDELRVLDVGAGPLAASIGVAQLAGERKLNVTAVDSAGAILADGAQILRTLCPDAEILTKTLDLRDRNKLKQLGAGYDLILVGNVLNEFKRSREREFPQVISLVRDLMTRLRDGGMLLIFEPGTRAAFDRVLSVREELVTTGDVHVVAPCLGAMACPLLAQRKRDWCHAEQPWRQPGHLKALDEAIGHHRKTLKFTYLALTNTAQEQARTTDNKWRIISGPMHSNGALRRYLCGADGRAVALARESGLARSHPLITAWRGDAEVLDGALSTVQRGRAEERVLKLAVAKPADSSRKTSKGPADTSRKQRKRRGSKRDGGG
jgi:ribosomal protein RSM22 (predicted rRNA methylase)